MKTFIVTIQMMPGKSEDVEIKAASGVSAFYEARKQYPKCLVVTIREKVE